jgi:ParB family chromosome partitioning protein
MDSSANGQNTNRSVLGRGIGSLLPESNKRGYFLCPIGELYPNHAQPRKQFDQEKLEELAQSIREKGVLQPLLVKKTDKGYVIIAGERRWRASQLAGKKEVPVIVKELSDHEILEIALIENIQRQDLNPIEESESYQRLIIDLGLTQDEVAKRVGKDRSTIANSLRLLKLSKEVRDKIATNELSVGHARCLISIEDKSLQNQIMEEILQKSYSVRQVEQIVKKLRESSSTQEAGQEAGAEPEPDWTAYNAVAQELKNYFDARVEIKAHGSGRGQIVVSFLSPEDFNRILGKMRTS